MPVGPKDRDDISGDKEAISDAAEKIRTLSSTRAATQQAMKATKADEYAVHLIPIEGVNETEAWDAAAWLEKSQAEERKLTEEAAAEDEKLYQYFLKCRTPHHTVGGRPAPPHGIYFKSRPSSAVGIHDWYSTYKKAESSQPLEEIVCQVCLKMGIEGARLHYEWQDRMRGFFIPDKRWVWKIPRNPARAKIEGMTRAFDLPFESSNRWRAESEQKLAKARQEGVLTDG